MPEPHLGGCVREAANAAEGGRHHCLEALRVQDELGRAGLESCLCVLFFAYAGYVGVLK